MVAALSNHVTVAEPERDEPHWWAGAPSATRDPETGEFWLVVRMRTAEGPRGSRGYELRLLKGTDGVRFSEVRRIHRNDLGVPVLERPALVRDERGRFVLYGCSAFLGQWAVWRLDPVDDPTDFDPGTLDVVLHPPARNSPAAALTGFKDPFVLRLGGRWHLTVIGEAHKAAARPYHYWSRDGVEWEPWPADVVAGTPLPFFEATGWHSWATRPACWLPLKFGVLMAYEGSNLAWHDAVYNLATGLAYSPDLTRWHDLTPDAPLLVSTTPGSFHTWRYSHWLPVDDHAFVYWEAARPNDSFETRAAKIPLDDAG